jgi:MFS family permease
VVNEMSIRAKSRSLHGLDWINACCADFQMAAAAYASMYLAAARHWSPGQIGIVVALQNLATMAVQVPVGAFIDRTEHKKRLVIMAGLLVALGALGILLGRGLWAQSLTQILIGVGSAVFAPAIAALSLGIVGENALSNRVGRNEMFNHGGKFLLAILAGSIGIYFGAQYSLYTLMLFGLGGASAGLLIRSSDVDNRAARASAATGEKSGMPIRRFLARRAVWAFFISVILFHISNAALLQVVGQRLARGHEQNSAFYISACIAVAQFVMVPMALVTSRLSRRFARKPLFACCYLIVAIRASLFAMGHSPAFLISVQSLDGVASAVFGVLWTMINADIAKGTGRFGLMQGAVACAWYFGAASSNYITGVIANHAGFSAGFMFECIVAVMGAAWFLLMMPETRESKPIFATAEAAA